MRESRLGHAGVLNHTLVVIVDIGSPWRGTLIDFSLILCSTVRFLMILHTTNLEPYVLDSTVFGCLLKDYIRALLIKRNIPEFEHLATTLLA